jgi:MFS family permease
MQAQPEPSDAAAVDTAIRAAPWREVFSGSRGRLVAGLLLLETVVAVHMLVVTAVMPAVLRDLGDLPLYGWSFSAASLAQFAAIPIAGAAVDRFGARRLLLLAAAVYTAGLLTSAVAPSMLVLAGGRFLQGAAAGAAYALSIGAVATTLPPTVRPRVLALMATSWLLPGLFGPPLGALLAQTVGWRWAFVVPLPILALSVVLAYPALTDTRGDGGERIPVGRALVLMLGAGAVLAGLTDLSIAGAVAIAIGLPVAVLALRRIVPIGTFSARRGIGAAGASAFLLSVAFAAGDSYVPLMMTEIRGTSVLAAGLTITVAAVTWPLGSWWQSRVAVRVPAGRLVLLGAALLTTGMAFVVTALAGWPLWLVYVGWGIAGLGLGIAFPTIPLAVMGRADEGREAGEVSTTLLMDMLGVAIGAGLGGASIALSQAEGWSLTAGIGGSFVVAFAAAFALLAVGPRIDERSPA